MYVCYNCQAELKLERGKVYKGDVCPNCDKDVRVCLNCSFHSKGVHNDCMETEAERVVEKKRENQCDFFRMREKNASANSVKKKGSTLFKDEDDVPPDDKPKSLFK